MVTLDPEARRYLFSVVVLACAGWQGRFKGLGVSPQEAQSPANQSPRLSGAGGFAGKHLLLYRPEGHPPLMAESCKLIRCPSP